MADAAAAKRASPAEGDGLDERGVEYLRLTGVHAFYGESHILHGVDLTVRRGEKAIVTLFVKRIQYSHIYRWSPPQPLQHFIIFIHSDNSAAGA